MPLDVALVGLQTFYNYCPTSTMFTIPLMTMHVVYNTLECLPTATYLLQHTASINNHYLPHAAVPSCLEVTTCWCSPFLLLPSIGCYFPMAANNLLRQSLPLGMPPYFLFKKKCKNIMKRSSIPCNSQIILPSTSPNKINVHQAYRSSSTIFH
jgi:hypothetical protein